MKYILFLLKYLCLSLTLIQQLFKIFSLESLSLRFIHVVKIDITVDVQVLNRVFKDKFCAHTDDATVKGIP